jgi:hypothetical protein
VKQEGEEGKGGEGKRDKRQERKGEILSNGISGMQFA